MARICNEVVTDRELDPDDNFFEIGIGVSQMRSTIALFLGTLCSAEPFYDRDER